MHEKTTDGPQAPVATHDVEPPTRGSDDASRVEFRPHRAGSTLPVKPAASGWWSRGAPALLLAIVAPLVAEFLLGDVTLASLGALIVFVPLYGGGALLIREVVRRRHGGWPAIAVLAAAFGLVEEGLATQSLFDPSYAHSHLLASGYVAALGIAIPWTVHVVSLHVIWSICTPIALVECLFPARRTSPWLSTSGLVITALGYALGVAATALVTWSTYRYLAPAPRLAAVAVLAAGLVAVGVSVATRRPAPPAPPAGPKRAPRESRRAPAAWVVGVTVAAAASVLVVAAQIPSAVGSTLTFLLVETAAVAAITVWSHRDGWRARHVLAVTAATLFAYAWRAFTTEPAFDTAPIALVRISNAAFAGLALMAVLIAARRVTPPGSSSPARSGPR